MANITLKTDSGTNITSINGASASKVFWNGTEYTAGGSTPAEMNTILTMHFKNTGTNVANINPAVAPISGTYNLKNGSTIISTLKTSSGMTSPEIFSTGYDLAAGAEVDLTIETDATDVAIAPFATDGDGTYSPTKKYVTSVIIGNKVTQFKRYGFTADAPTYNVRGNYSSISCEEGIKIKQVDSTAIYAIGSSKTIKNNLVYFGPASNPYMVLISSVANSNLTSINIEEGCITIGGDASSNIRSTLASITFPTTLEYISDGDSYSVSKTNYYDGCFYSCTKLTNVVFKSSSLKSIGSYSFTSCTGLTSINIPSSVTRIGMAAFYQCTNLTTAYINTSGLMSIEYRSFNLNLTAASATLTLNMPYQAIVPSLNQAFQGVDYVSAIRVPSASVDEYKAASNWSTYASKIVAYS